MSNISENFFNYVKVNSIYFVDYRKIKKLIKNPNIH